MRALSISSLGKTDSEFTCPAAQDMDHIKSNVNGNDFDATLLMAFKPAVGAKYARLQRPLESEAPCLTLQILSVDR